MNSKDICISNFYECVKGKILNGYKDEVFLVGLNEHKDRIQLLLFEELKKEFHISEPKDYYLKVSNIKDFDLLVNESIIYIVAIVTNEICVYSYNRLSYSHVTQSSGDTGDSNLLQLKSKRCLNSNITPSFIKLSRNGSIAAITHDNGDIYVLDLDDLITNELEIKTIIIKSKPLQIVRDISPDATSLITLSTSLSRIEFWDIEINKKTIELYYGDNYQIIDACFSRIEAVEHLYNLFSIYNLINNQGYALIQWDCTKLIIKNSMKLNNKVCDMISVDNQGRYVCVLCQENGYCIIDVFVSYNLQRLHSFKPKQSCNVLIDLHFLPLTLSISSLEHEFDLIALFQQPGKNAIAEWFYEDLRQSYSVIWPILGAVILIMVFFYVIANFGP